LAVKAKRVVGLGPADAVVEAQDPAAEAAALKAERIAVCEEQMREDQAAAQRILVLIGRGIAAWQEKGFTWGLVPELPPSEWRGLFKLSFLIAQLLWLERRITQTEMMATPLWCPGCTESSPYPGSAWMKFECLAHAEVMNMREAANLGRSLFSFPQEPSSP
jgi:hypothetical protein